MLVDYDKAWQLWWIHGGLSLTVQRLLNLTGLLKFLKLFVHRSHYLLNMWRTHMYVGASTLLIPAFPRPSSTPSNLVKIVATPLYYKGTYVGNWSKMGRCKRDDTSSSMMVISPMGRSKELVSPCHLSTKAEINPFSPTS